MVKMYSMMAAALAIVYADPFWEKRNEEMDALGGLYRAVVQNSRKWKSERRARKKGSRQWGVDAMRRRYRAMVEERLRTMPRRSERIAMPESDLGCPGRYCLE